MLDKEGAGRLIEYTVWANHRVMRAAATLSVDDFKRDLGSSFGGVRGTLCHVMGAEWIWLERWKGLSPTRMPDEAEFADVLALRERWRAVEEHREAWFRSLGEDAPGQVISYRTTGGTEFENPLWQLVQHVANHSSYHRGQVTTLLRQLGAKAVATDMVAWDRDRQPKETAAS
jgi:uncharacterized damage-inducible protein DinB